MCREALDRGRCQVGGTRVGGTRSLLLEHVIEVESWYLLLPEPAVRNRRGGGGGGERRGQSCYLMLQQRDVQGAIHDGDVGACHRPDRDRDRDQDRRWRASIRTEERLPHERHEDRQCSISRWVWRVPSSRDHNSKHVREAFNGTGGEHR
jgi:hypothetical protein